MDEMCLIRQCLKDDVLVDWAKLAVINFIVNPVEPTTRELQWAKRICDSYAERVDAERS